MHINQTDSSIYGYIFMLLCIHEWFIIFGGYHRGLVGAERTQLVTNKLGSHRV
jgi:hypothetical protein